MNEGRVLACPFSMITWRTSHNAGMNRVGTIDGSGLYSLPGLHRRQLPCVDAPRREPSDEVFRGRGERRCC